MRAQIKGCLELGHKCILLCRFANSDGDLRDNHAMETNRTTHDRGTSFDHRYPTNGNY